MCTQQRKEQRTKEYPSWIGIHYITYLYMYLCNIYIQQYTINYQLQHDVTNRDG